MSLLYSGLEINTRIRAYDFDRMNGLIANAHASDRTESYVEGRIIADIMHHGAAMYEILCDYDSHYEREGETVLVPHETMLDTPSKEWPRVVDLDATLKRVEALWAII